MIRTFIAHTEEIDDVEVAVQEIQEQLDIQKNLGKNTVGIMTCHYEFVFSGVAKAICDAMPFDVLGTVTLTQATNHAEGTFLLTLTVLTDDDAVFATKLTPSLKETPSEHIEAAYIEAAGGEAAAEKEKPALILAYAPFMFENFGDEYVDVLTKASGGVPCFGTFAIDDTDVFEKDFLIFNGEFYLDRLAMVLVYADIRPRFLIATISPEKVLDKAALITKSERHLIHEVNGRPVTEYFDSLGLTDASESSYAMSSLPFMLDYGDGTPPVSKVFVSLTPDKCALCAGVMPEGSTLYIGVFDKEDVLLTSGKALDQALADLDDASVMLIYSCISRSLSLGGASMEELNLAQEKIGEKLPFLMAYSGGEICPTQVDAARAVNRFHNNAFIACIF